MVIANETIPLYFVLPASLHSGNTVTAPLATVSETVVSSGKLDPAKYYEIKSIEPAFPNAKGYVVGDRFTGISVDIEGKGTVSEVIGSYPLKSLKFDSSPVLGITDAGKIIVSLLIKRYWIKQIKKLAQNEMTTNEDLMLIAKFENAYIGPKEKDVTNRFPELLGTTGIGENETLRLMQHSWSME